MALNNFVKWNQENFLSLKPHCGRKQQLTSVILKFALYFLILSSLYQILRVSSEELDGHNTYPTSASTTAKYSGFGSTMKATDKFKLFGKLGSGPNKKQSLMKGESRDVDSKSLIEKPHENESGHMELIRPETVPTTTTTTSTMSTTSGIDSNDFEKIEDIKTSTNNRSSTSSKLNSSTSNKPMESMTSVTTTNKFVVSNSKRSNLMNGEQEEKLLLRALVNGYEKDVRPVINASKPVLIQVGITLTQIFDMDEKNQVLTTNVWLDQEWNDELLQWNPDDFGGLKSIRLPCKLIWLPDIVLYNNADDYTRGYFPSRAMIANDGNVFWPPPTKFRSTCPVDVTYFPFDDQTCTLKLGSWTYNGYQVDITNRTSEVDLSNYVENGEWELLEAQLQRNVVYYSCCPEPFPDVTVTLIIRRKTLYYIYNIVLPCIMLSVLTLLVFCLPPDSGEKVGLGITVLLAFSVFMLAIAEKMPETSESIPLIGIYLTCVMAITSVSVLSTIFVLNLHYLGPRVQPIPSWLRCFLPKGDIDFLREKSLLLPYSAKIANRRRQQHYLISEQKLNQSGPTSYSTSIPPINTSQVTLTNIAVPSMKLPASTNVSTEPLNKSINNMSFQMRNNNDKMRRNWLNLSVNSEQMDDNHQDLELGDHHGEVEEDIDEPSSAESIENETIIGNTSYTSHKDQMNGQQGMHLLRRRHKSAQNIHKVKFPTHMSSPSKRGVKLNTSTSKHGSNPSKTHLLSASSSTTLQYAAKIQEELLQSIRHLLTKQEELEFQNLLVAEWRLVAQVVDRILFWIFFLITVASSGVFLIILPLYKRSWNGPN